ncbi:DNA mismatch repair endonuclease MutL [Alicyclobacillus fastidiosus]|uniref:DNA mismatch repair protein MutL n=1 Tax=Alicyclobacillus fastidiosus TaxID=392011 RepID=A0ABY6ZB57_9BACL|nr:DNA mismatch repair endonuclease MutL [Alicyclobacillus fastidiosus]WAH40125.1 DNA mismatch repair endonuclease MutL [Alicyclobacillus fastidiosus]GMA61463.1 DNA mismatch repair protein MutL [Alicyclobacillus fastidiosus]
MGNIQTMSTSLANQIAAGEVVVRPASCVKELLENSLDAGAKQITVTLREGGIAQIIVQDDGAGMDEEDAQIAFFRHATSKLFHERDLVRIHTLGFRGEALASIAAVSRVTLTTRERGCEYGVCVRVEGGEMSPVEHVGATFGTRIEVADLFYNTPARLKYLRTVQTEQAKSVETVQKAALSRPDVAFTCQTEHHVLFQTPGNGDVRAVLAALYGVGEAKQLLAIEEATPDYRVTGFIGRPTQGRNSKAQAHLFVNGRPVRNVAVHQAVVQGYKNRLMIGKQPVYSIAIAMDPSLVDVNVHPHKAEVRFSEEADVCRCVARAVAKALDGTLLAPTPEGRRPREVSEAQPFALDFRPRQADEGTGRDKMRASGSGPRLAYPSGARPQTATARELDMAYGRPPSGEVGAEALVTGGQGAPSNAPDDRALPEEPYAEARKQNWQLRPIGQALGMYVLADDGESLYIIDQHAAHERILFEEFYKRLSGRQVHAMPLLAPMQLTLTPSVYTRVTEEIDRLSQLGLTIDPFGGYDVVVRTVPDVWEGLDVHALVEETIARIPSAGASTDDFFQTMHDVIATRACKAAVKANWYLSQEELEALCHALTEADDPFHCPHGRPIFLQWTGKQLEKEFKRIV